MADETQEKRLNVRADASLIDAFITCCEANDRTASQVVRDYMRDYVKRHGQTELFSAKRATKNV